MTVENGSLIRGTGSGGEKKKKEWGAADWEHGPKMRGACAPHEW